MAPLRRRSAIPREECGFTLVETMIALFVLVFGLMAAGALIALAAGSASLARSKGNGAILAESKLVYLMDLHRRDPNAGDVALGDHGPEEIQIWNRTSGRILDRYRITWSVAGVPDPRPKKQTGARQVSITVIPVDAAGNRHSVPLMNKGLVLAAVLSRRF